jgi:hypothetical protein
MDLKQLSRRKLFEAVDIAIATYCDQLHWDIEFRSKEGKYCDSVYGNSEKDVLEYAELHYCARQEGWIPSKPKVASLYCYTRNLNAMHAAEKRLSDVPPDKDTQSDLARYRFQLCVVCAGRGGPIVSSSPSRAESFVRTLKLLDLGDICLDEVV